MSASSVIGDVTRTLEAMLTSEQLSPPFDVSLISPAEEDPTKLTKPTVNLFLFRVTENPFAKNQDWAAVGASELSRPPLALNLFYVLTPFAKDKVDEYSVLGEAMRVFYENSIIPDGLLKGSLENAPVELKVDLLQTSFEDLARIWTALTKPYRLSVCYEIRMALIDSPSTKASNRAGEMEDRLIFK